MLGFGLNLSFVWQIHLLALYFLYQWICLQKFVMSWKWVRHLWCHKAGDIVEQFSGEFLKDITGKSATCIIIVMLFYQGDKKLKSCSYLAQLINTMKMDRLYFYIISSKETKKKSFITKNSDFMTFGAQSIHHR